MRLTTAILLMAIFACITLKAQDTPSKDHQIGAAVMAAPEEARAGATVWGFSSEGKMILLREGTNNFICLADDPTRPGFSVSAYHKDLEPFMARGRELKEQGKSNQEIFDIREAEVKAGTLKMPESGATLHVLSGKEGQYNPESGTVTGATLRYVVYIPWATSESTGLPLKPIVPGGPWIMDPGTHRAHIMINPPADNP
ncbi:MAG: hypothetical protein SF052_18825 [Bacteroidia bacterium]|nr:hypothetical protein [Bacteroidia bacterium]